MDERIHWIPQKHEMVYSLVTCIGWQPCYVICYCFDNSVWGTHKCCKCIIDFSSNFNICFGKNWCFFVVKWLETVFKCVFFYWFVSLKSIWNFKLRFLDLFRNLNIIFLLRLFFYSKYLQFCLIKFFSIWKLVLIQTEYRNLY